MGKGISQSVGAHELEPVSLSTLIHQHVRAAIETAVHEESRAALGTSPYERNEVRRGYRNGIRERTLTGPTGPVVLALPRATLFRGASAKEWTSTIDAIYVYLDGFALRVRRAGKVVSVPVLGVVGVLSDGY